MLILAPIFDWPYGYYQFLKLIVCVTSGMISFSEYKSGHKNQAAFFALIALIFNPVFVLDLDNRVWSAIDFGVAGLWIYFLWNRGIKFQKIVAIFIIPLILVARFVFGFIYKNVEQYRSNQKAKIQVQKWLEEKQEKETIKREEKLKVEEIEKEKKLERWRVQKEEQIKMDTERRTTFENTEIIKFSIIETNNLSAYTVHLTIKNNNGFPIDSIYASVYFFSQDGDLMRTEERIELLEVYQILKPGDLKYVEQYVRRPPLSIKQRVDLTKTKIKITEVRKAEQNIFKLAEIRDAARATSISNDKQQPN